MAAPIVIIYSSGPALRPSGCRAFRCPWHKVYATVEKIEEFLDAHVLLRKNDVLGQMEYRIPEADPTGSGD